MRALLPLLALPLCACPRQPGELPSSWSFVEAAECASPTSGLDRFSEEAAERGLDTDVQAMRYGPAFVVAHDLDADGDIDLIIKDGQGGILRLHSNDGSGHFSPGPTLDLPIDWPVDGAVVVGDVDGDSLADLIVVPATDVWLLRNQGGSFATGEQLWTDPQDAQYRHLSLALGDADADGDLDLLLPAHEAWNAGPPPHDPGPNPQFDGTPDELLFLDDGAYVDHLTLDNGTRSLVLAATFSDFDGDGDQDIMVPSDRALPNAIWRNDAGSFTDVAPQHTADIALDGMGMDTTDFNGDGLLDYCFTDSGPLRCLVSSDSGFQEAGDALGMMPAQREATPWTVGWTIEFADFDHDGWMDAFQSAGTMFDGVNMPAEGWLDLLWAGTEGHGFQRQDGVGPAGERGDHYGAAVADFDGDGWLDVAVSPDIGPPSLWMNRCGEGRFLDVELIDSTSSNREAFGARVEVTVLIDGEPFSRVRELHSLRGQGQGPSRLHFGLGDVAIAEAVTVVWPDGERQQVDDVATGGWLTIVR